MFDFVYLEEAASDHPRACALLSRYPDARVVPCERFGEVFNRRAQNFRLQKRRPALIVAAKHGNLVLDAPPGHGIGHARNYYFSHMLNCVYDCRYCFLQGMYRSAHLVVFVNFEDFHAAIRERSEEGEGDACFFSGYDCDSLALEPLTGFAESFVEMFAALPASVCLELRTKSVQIGRLLERDAASNCIVAFSLLPAELASLEPGVPSLSRRLDAARRLLERGWPVGVRFDPLIHCDDAERVYGRFFDTVFRTLPGAALHSVSVGPFRLPLDFHRRMEELHSGDALFVRGLEERDRTVSYRSDLAEPLLAFATEAILEHVPRERLFAAT